MIPSSNHADSLYDDSLYDDPDDADELRQCIQNAKDKYESCIEECDS
jgi:hypothetical protein